MSESANRTVSPGVLILRTTENHLLNGRIAYTQPAAGFRTGIEPVLLSAAVPARRGERVLEGGAGAGAALLCLAARVAALQGVGIDRDASLVALAAGNAAANAATGLRFLTADLTAAPVAGTFDHAMANPPYHAPEGTASPLPAREQAKRGGPELLAAWTRALAAPLRHRGTLTLIVPAATLPECLAAMNAGGCATRAILPLWPKPGLAAKLVIVQGVKGGRMPLRLLPGLVLHGGHGGYTEAADAILRGGGALALQ
ncbi:MAG TPA: methyltransferase [Acetobacteraceae bacterium]|nr:methyltransferase [Acetobacteraceae bacterium]